MSVTVATSPRSFSVRRSGGRVGPGFFLFREEVIKIWFFPVLRSRGSSSHATVAPCLVVPGAVRWGRGRSETDLPIRGSVYA